jgi:1,4-dihydroxy-2-naphthoate octaprenyltransferase
VENFPRFKTLSRKDSEFNSYLDGSFSNVCFAIPTRSLNVDSKAEEVTFEIKPQSEILKPRLAKVVFTLIRPSTLIFSMGPMSAAFFQARAHKIWLDHWLAVTAFLGILSFHISTNLMNDFGDHIKGQDRLRISGGSRVIQNGWLRAHTVKKAAIGLIGLSIVLGLPSLFHAPVLLIAGAALFVSLEFAFQKLRLKKRGLSEILAFLLTGPLLTCGFGWATSNRSDLATAALGCVFGSLALMYFHSANFENIMPDTQAGVRTWATRTGFDASKRFFIFTAFACTLSTTGLIYVEHEVKLLPALAVEVLLLVFACLRVLRIASPVASDLLGLRIEAVRLCWVMTLALVSIYYWMA